MQSAAHEMHSAIESVGILSPASLFSRDKSAAEGDIGLAINIDGVEKEHVVEAAARWSAEPGYGGFGESTRYDILIEGRP
ncbi:hypothetical protein WS79_01230 [Burkholderia territorii]|nr:hypothetical protein WS79_01230 [Burkholderia territorii]